MTPEHASIPEWARRERLEDLEWIEENLNLFQTTADLAFIHAGRGAIFVDTTTQLAPDAGYLFGYISQEQIEEAANDDTRRMVKEYTPLHELVVVLLKPGDRISTYRVSADPSENSDPATSNETTGHAGEPPDLETLMQWEAKGGCVRQPVLTAAGSSRMAPAPTVTPAGY